MNADAFKKWAEEIAQKAQTAEDKAPYRKVINQQLEAQLAKVQPK